MSPCLEEERAAERTCDELTETPIPHPSVLQKQGEGRENQMWSSAWEDRRGGRKVL